MRYEFEAEPEFVVTECNCSVCTKSGYLGVTVPGDRFRLLCGEDDLSEYTFKTGTAGHRFCRHCGIKSFYVPRSHPDGISVNFRCIGEATARAFSRSLAYFGANGGARPSSAHARRIRGPGTR